MRCLLKLILAAVLLVLLTQFWLVARMENEFSPRQGWEASNRYIATFQATGCPNTADVAGWWRTQADATVWDDMYLYCDLVKTNRASKKQQATCCGGTAANPKQCAWLMTCTKQTKWAIGQSDCNADCLHNHPADARPCGCLHNQVADAHRLKGGSGSNARCGSHAHVRGEDATVWCGWFDFGCSSACTDVTMFGATFSVAVATASIWAQHLQVIEEGHWERSTFLLYNQELRPSDTYIGFGTWIGPMLLFAGTRVKRAYGFEPDQLAFAEAARSIEVNSPAFQSRVVLSHKCVSHMRETISIAGNGGSGSVVLSSASSDAMRSAYDKLVAGGAPHYEVPCDTLQAMLPDLGKTTPLFIKIDCEGAESFVVPQMAPWLASFSPKPKVLLSLHARGTAQQVEEIFQVARGYKFFAVIEADKSLPDDGLCIPLRPTSELTHASVVECNSAWQDLYLTDDDSRATDCLAARATT